MGGRACESPAVPITCVRLKQAWLPSTVAPAPGFHHTHVQAQRSGVTIEGGGEQQHTAEKHTAHPLYSKQVVVTGDAAHYVPPSACAVSAPSGSKQVSVDGDLGFSIEDPGEGDEVAWESC
jgi:hypothetical protein